MIAFAVDILKYVVGFGVGFVSAADNYNYYSLQYILAFSLVESLR